jgi:HEAT repeat protein
MKKLLLTCATLLLLTGCGGGPSFNGKSLSYWLSEARSAAGPQRRQAVQALGEIGKSDRTTLPTVLPALLVALKDKDVDGRRAAAEALGKQGADAKNALPDLVASLSDSDKDVRSNSAQALVLIDPKNDKLVAPLVKLLQDSEIDVRKSAVVALGDMGPTAKPALPDLELTKGQQENKKDFDFLRMVAEAITKITRKTPE